MIVTVVTNRKNKIKVNWIVYFVMKINGHETKQVTNKGKKNVLYCIHSSKSNCDVI
jgi:hypothetical protein